MPSSRTSYTGDGSTAGPYTAPAYIEKAHVTATVAGVSASFTWTNDTQITFTSPPANSAAIKIQRATPNGTTSFANGAALDQNALNTLRRAAQYQREELEDATDAVDLNARITAEEAATSSISSRVTTEEAATSTINSRLAIEETISSTYGTRLAAEEAATTSLEAYRTATKEVITYIDEFGVVGNGSTDDSTAFQAAVDYCQTNGTILELNPAGHYRLNSQITIKQGGSDSTDFVAAGGENGWGLVLRGNMARITSAYAGPAIHVQPRAVIGTTASGYAVGRVEIRDLDMRHSGSSTSAAAIQMGTTGRFAYDGQGRRLTLKNIRVNVSFASNTTGKHISILNCSGVHLDQVQPTHAGLQVYFGCPDFNNSVGFSGTGNLYVNDCYFKSNASLPGFVLDAIPTEAKISGSGRSVINDVWFDRCEWYHGGLHMQVGENAGVGNDGGTNSGLTNVWITNCQFNGGETGLAAIKGIAHTAGSMHSIYIKDCNFGSPSRALHFAEPDATPAYPAGMSRIHWTGGSVSGVDGDGFTEKCVAFFDDVTSGRIEGVEINHIHECTEFLRLENYWNDVTVRNCNTGWGGSTTDGTTAGHAATFNFVYSPTWTGYAESCLVSDNYIHMQLASSRFLKLPTPMNASYSEKIGNAINNVNGITGKLHHSNDNVTEIDVRMFGALPIYGDGTQNLGDQSTSIQEAIDYCQENNRVLVFPPNEQFVVEDTLEIKIGLDPSASPAEGTDKRRGLIIKGNNAELRAKGLDGPILKIESLRALADYTSGDGHPDGHLEVENLTLSIHPTVDGVSAHANTYGIQVGSGTNVIRPTKRWLFKNVNITGRAGNYHANAPIKIEQARLIKFESCHSITGGVHLREASTQAEGFTGDIWFDSCDFRNGGIEGGTSVSKDRPVWIEAAGTTYTSGVNSANVESVFFQNCHFYHGGVLLYADETAAINNIAFDNCQFDLDRDSVQVGGSWAYYSREMLFLSCNGQGTYQGTMRSISVTGCKFVGYTDKPAIRIYGDIGAGGGSVRPGGVQQLAVTGCSIHGDPFGSTTTVAPIALDEGTLGATVSGNNFGWTGTATELVTAAAGDAEALVFGSNTLLDGESLTRAVYWESAAGRELVVTGNVLRGVTAASISGSGGTEVTANNT